MNNAGSDVRRRHCKMWYSAQIETDSSVTGEDKQISHCWGSHCKADIIMSLVSVRRRERRQMAVWSGAAVGCQQRMERAVVSFKGAPISHVLSHGAIPRREENDGPSQ